MRKKGWSKYGKELRKKIVQEYLTTDAGLRDLEKKYGVCFNTIHYWVKADERSVKDAKPVSSETES